MFTPSAIPAGDGEIPGVLRGSFHRAPGRVETDAGTRRSTPQGCHGHNTKIWTTRSNALIAGLYQHNAEQLGRTIVTAAEVTGTAASSAAGSHEWLTERRGPLSVT
ncbi:hypothetical protein [Streptomyces lavendulocolor]|uniref:hypothetical protein n=1 Tax=Streptomyces lavendulocolor TaxID=67316 RepID=UPI0033F400B9